MVFVLSVCAAEDLPNISQKRYEVKRALFPQIKKEKKIQSHLGLQTHDMFYNVRNRYIKEMLLKRTLLSQSDFSVQCSSPILHRFLGVCAVLSKDLITVNICRGIPPSGAEVGCF